MIPLERVGVILLAAGRSTRFGSGDKLTQDWRGKPLVRHAADILAALPFATHLAVVSGKFDQSLPGVFGMVENSEPERGLSRSIALGAAAITSHDLDACLIALADMPMVPSGHFQALVEAADAGPDSLVATNLEGRGQVPALFGRSHFDALQALEGDRGAAGLLRGARKVDCDPSLLVDFDRPGDFA
jgi:molybdenum cofactor cytidylyltransferase